MSIEQFSKEAQAKTNALFPIEILYTVSDYMKKTDYYNNLIIDYWKRNPEELELRKKLT